MSCNVCAVRGKALATRMSRGEISLPRKSSPVIISVTMPGVGAALPLSHLSMGLPKPA